MDLPPGGAGGPPPMAPALAPAPAPVPTLAPAPIPVLTVPGTSFAPVNPVGLPLTPVPNVGAPPIVPNVGVPVPVAAAPPVAPGPPSVHKEKKAKKHKKHKSNKDGSDDGNSQSGSGGLDQAGIKLRIKVGSGGPGAAGGGPGGPTGGSGGTSEEALKKKKKKKKEKKKEKEKKHKHHHKEKRKRTEEDPSAVVPLALGGSLNPLTLNPDHPHAPAAKRIKTDAGLADPSSSQLPLPSSSSDPSSLASQEVKPVVAVISEQQAKLPVQPVTVPKVEGGVPSGKTPLQDLLDYLIPILERADTGMIFAAPVTDAVAPGYSQIIKYPMDFSTIKAKNASGQYKHLREFRQDFQLMTNNCMTYNNQDTIYYKAARRILSIGQRLLSQDRLIRLREQGNLMCMRELTQEMIGFDIMADPREEESDDDDDDDEENDGDDVDQMIRDIKGSVKRPPGRFEAIPDDLTSTEILEQAKKAAQGAAEKLKLYKARSQLGFLRQKNDGSTSLSFLTGGSGVVPGTEKDRPVLLGSLVGKVKQGTGSMMGFLEDRRNVAKMIHPLYYGAFSSHGPTYDSTFANLTKDETDLVYSTYGNETGVQYADSIINFSRDSDYASLIVDNLLDIITGYEHKQTARYLEQEKLMRKEAETMEATFKDAQKIGPPEGSASAAEDDKNKIDFESLKSLSDQGIDMSFLDNLKTEYESSMESQSAEAQLANTASLITSLQATQNERLSAPPPQHFAAMPKPGAQELKLAEQIQSNLLNMTKRLQPKDVVPEDAVRMLLGIPKVKEESPDNNAAAATAVSSNPTVPPPVVNLERA